MSYRVVGYQDGKPIRIDEGPAYGGSAKIGGSLVQGAPGPYEQARINARAHVQRMLGAEGRCGAWMPVAESTCIRSTGHRADHRATRTLVGRSGRAA